MAVMILIKQPAEVRTYAFDYSNFPEISTNGEVISSVQEIAVDTPGLTLGTPYVSPDGKRVHVKVSGGVDGTTYKLSCRAVTDQGHTLEIDGKIQVKEY